jgi:F-type H+-transporting ATPase subunit delta
MTETAREYGAALFELSLETGTLQAVADGLTLAETQFREQPEYLKLLASPGIPKEERLNAIRGAFEGTVSEYVLSFLCLLCENGRMGEFFPCAETFETLYRESMKISTAKVFSAVPLTDREQTRLRETLEKRTGHRIQLACTVDHTLLGGVVVEMDDQRLDGSLKRRLKVLKEVMNQ